MACKPEREGAPNTRLQLTVAMHLGAREGGGESRESGALGRPQLKRRPLGLLGTILVVGTMAVTSCASSANQQMFALLIHPLKPLAPNVSAGPGPELRMILPG